MPMHRVFPLRFSVEFHDLAFAAHTLLLILVSYVAHKFTNRIIYIIYPTNHINQSTMKLFLLSTSAILFTNSVYAAQDYTATKVS